MSGTGREGAKVDAFLSGFVTGADTPRSSKSRCASERAHASELLIAHIFSSDVWPARGDKFHRSLTSVSLPLSPPSLIPRSSRESCTWEALPLGSDPWRSPVVA